MMQFVAFVTGALIGVLFILIGKRRQWSWRKVTAIAIAFSLVNGMVVSFLFH